MRRHNQEPNKPPAPTPTRERIVAAARQHFFAHGFRGVTMDDLAATLGMSKKTLYAHFPSKNALLEAMLREKLRHLEDEVARVTADHADDFITGLHGLLACVQRHAAEVQPPFLRDVQREAPELFQVVEGRRREIIQRYFTKLLEEGRRERLIRKDVPVHLVIDILLAATTAVVNPPKLLELGLTPQSGFTAVITVILEGVLTHEGRTRL